MAPASGAAASHVKFYRTLALTLFLGAIVAVILATADVRSFSMFEPESAFFALGFVSLVIVIVTVLFLLRIGAIFEVEGQLNKLLSDGEAKLEQRLRSQEEAWASHKQDLKNDLMGLKDQWRSEQRAQDDRIGEAMAMAANAKQVALEAAMAAGEKTTRRINEMAPLLAALEAEVKNLRRDLHTVNTRVETTVEALERSEMEAAAARQKAEAELAQLRKREQLLVIKSKEVEDQLSAATPRNGAAAKLTPAEEKEHVMLLDLEPQHASRLNAHGIISLSQLLTEKPEKLAGIVDADQELVRTWQATAALLKVRDVTPQQAEAMVRAGITSVQQLSTQDPEGLARRLREVRGRPLNPAPTAAQAHLWITAAKRAANP